MASTSFMTKKSVVIGVGAFCGVAALALGLGLGLGLKKAAKTLPQCTFEPHLVMLKKTVPFNGGQWYNVTEFEDHWMYSVGNGTESEYDQMFPLYEDVENGDVVEQVKKEPEVYVMAKSKPLSCIDARNPEKTIGTPGGEMAEFINGLNLYLEYNQVQTSTLSVKLQELVTTMMKKYIDEVSWPEGRKFFYHTSTDKMIPALSNIGLKFFPQTKPADFEAFLVAMSNTSAQGCGHIKYMMTEPEKYKVPTTVVTAAIRSLYQLYFDDSYKDKILIHSYQYYLRGRGVVIIKHHRYNESHHCYGYEPYVAPTIRNETIYQDSVFVYHEGYANEFRGNTIAPFFDLYTIDVQDRANVQFELSAHHIAHNLPIAEVALFNPGEKEEEETTSSSETTETAAEEPAAGGH